MFVFASAVSFSQQKTNLLHDTISLCVGDSATLELKHYFDNTTSVNWTTPYGIIANTKKISAHKAGKYYVRVTSPNFASALIDSSYVKLYFMPKRSLRDTTVCKEKSIFLNAKNDGMRYTWNTNETTQKIKVETAGTYWVRITNGVCVLTDTVNVRFVQGSNALINKDVMFCLNEENKLLSVKVNSGTKILWNTGETSASIKATKEGTYWVKTQANYCEAQTDTVKVKLKVCECEMIIPNSFTPNEDGRNDYFFPVLQCEYSYFVLTITDRWNNTIFSSNSPHAKWDGRFKGNLCPEDIYVYKIESTEKGSDKKQVRSGRISLFR